MFSIPKVDLHDNTHKIIMLIVMTILWTFLYIIVHFTYNPKQKISRKIVLDTKNRVISIIHGVGSFVMGSCCFLTN